MEGIQASSFLDNSYITLDVKLLIKTTAVVYSEQMDSQHDS